MRTCMLFAWIWSAGIAAAQPIWTSESRSIGFSSYASLGSDGGTLSSNGDFGHFIWSRTTSSSGSCGESGSAIASARAAQNSRFEGPSLIASGTVSCTAHDESSQEPCGAGASASSAGVAEFTITGDCRYFLSFDLRSVTGRAHVRIWNRTTGMDIERFEPRFNAEIWGGTAGVLEPGDYSISWGCDAVASTSGIAGMSGSYDISLELYDPRPLCTGDFNQNGGTDGGDVEAFFLAWEPGEMAADVNRDGGVDGADVEEFFMQWEQGGCDL